MKIVISGGTGFIGSKLIPLLHQQGHQVVVLTRNARKAKEKLSETVECVEWTPLQPGEWQHCLDGADVVIHLAGKAVVEKRWSAAVKKADTGLSGNNNRTHRARAYCKPKIRQAFLSVLQVLGIMEKRIYR